MNKYRGIYGVILGVMIAGALSACGSPEAAQTFDTKSRKGVSEVLEEAISEADSKNTVIEESAVYGDNEEKESYPSFDEGNTGISEEINETLKETVKETEINPGLKKESDTALVDGSDGKNGEKPDEALDPEKKTLTGAEQEESDGIDVDLSEMSGTMVFAEVYNMMMDPMAYIGKTVRMNGSFAVYHDDEKNKDHYACIIRDATACCEQGVEFILSDGYSFPDDYPKEGEEISVTGVVNTYNDGEYTYWALMDAEKD